MRTARTSRVLISAAIGLVALVSAGVSNADGPMERGEKLFDLCTQCHGPEGEGMRLSLAPSIAGLGEWYVAAQLRVFQSGARGTHPDDLAGLRMHPMSRWLRSDADIDAVAAYVANLPVMEPERLVEGGDPKKGETLYTTCANCHGPDGSGNQTVNAPRLRSMSDWYLLSSLEKYKTGARGTNPQNPNSMLMRGMAYQLTDEQSMKDLVAYIMTLSDSN